MGGRILIAGSINMDIVVNTKVLPRPSETVKGDEIRYFPGGKGANQATAASRLGGNVCFIGKIGDDSFGETLLTILNDEKINTQGVSRSDLSSGIAIITVDNKGENTIVITSGSNQQVTSEYIAKHEHLLLDADIVLSQFEIPLDSVETLFSIAKKAKKKTILNPSPAMQSSEKILALTDYICVNEMELSYFSNDDVIIEDMKAITHAAKKLLSKGPEVVIVTLGSRGVLAVTNSGEIYKTGIKVNAIDTTAAGDCFVGALAVLLGQGAELAQALDFANKAASISVTRWGASSSLPYLSEMGV